MKRYILLVSLAASLFNAHPIAAQSPCHVSLTTAFPDRRDLPKEFCEFAVGSQTITLGGEGGFATVTLSGGALQENYDNNFGEVYHAYAGRTCQGLPARLDFHFSRKVFNPTIQLNGQPESGGSLDVTVSDNKGRSYVQKIIGMGGFYNYVGFSGEVNHITITTNAPSWWWEIYGIQFDDEANCPGNPSPSPSPTPTRSSSDDVGVAPLPGPTRSSTDSKYYGVISPAALDQTVRKFDGPIHRDVDVERVVGELNSDGTLKYATDLVNNKVISRYATLSIPAYDVDFTGGERDHILFNGVEIGTNGSKAYLQGGDK